MLSLRKNAYEVGDKAPDFSVRLIGGRDFGLFDRLKSSSVLINFIRGTWCEECTNHLKRVEQWREQLSKRRRPVATVIITVEKEANVLRWLNDNPTPYLFAADENGHVAQRLGFMIPEDAYSKPGVVLIDRDHTIRIISDDLKASRVKAEKELQISRILSRRHGGVH